MQKAPYLVSDFYIGELENFLVSLLKVDVPWFLTL